MSDTSGPSSSTPFAFYDPDSSSLRMSQGTFLSDSIGSSPTLPKSGSMRNGALFERPMPVPATAAPDCSSLPTLPTPRSQIDEDRNNKLWPRPEDQPQNLENALARVLLPSPRTSDANGPGYHGDGGMDLRTTVDLLPTPTRRDHKGHNQRHDETCLTGALTDLPSPDMPLLSDDPPPALWTDEDG